MTTILRWEMTTTILNQKDVNYVLTNVNAKDELSVCTSMYLVHSCKILTHTKSFQTFFLFILFFYLK